MQGKTFLSAIYLCTRAILYPGSKICVASSTRSQANETLAKIEEELMLMSPMLRFEILECKIGSNRARILFRNGSWIKVVTAADSGRGSRANILYIDEFVKVDPTVITMVLKKFLTAPRSPGYLNKPEYADVEKERNIEIYTSSAWLKSHWSYRKLQSYFSQMLDDKRKYFVCGLPYQIAIKEGLLDRRAVEDEMTESDFNEMIWAIEMCCLFYGDINGAFFDYDDVSDRRRLKEAWYPPKDKKDKGTFPPLAPGERRILSLDVALLASKKQNNDAASIFINSALPASNGKYIANFIYTENHEGLHSSDLALLVRRLYEHAHCTDIVIDVKGLGTPIADLLFRDISDPDFGTVYPPLCCCNDETFAIRCQDKKAPKVVWCVQATAQFNHNMYIQLRDGFMQGYINLLVNEFEAEASLGKIKGYKKMDIAHKTQYQMPYINTTMLVNEMINLERAEKGSLVKLSEKSGMRKDRVSSIGYNYYVVNQIENMKKKKISSPIDYTSKYFKIRKPRKVTKFS